MIKLLTAFYAHMLTKSLNGVVGSGLRFILQTYFSSVLPCMTGKYIIYVPAHTHTHAHTHIYILFLLHVGLKGFGGRCGEFFLLCVFFLLEHFCGNLLM